MVRITCLEPGLVLVYDVDPLIAALIKDCSDTGMKVSWQLSSNFPLNSTMSAWSTSLEKNKSKACVVIHYLKVFHVLVIRENLHAKKLKLYMSKKYNFW